MRNGEYDANISTKIEDRFLWKYKKWCGLMIKRIFKQKQGYKTITNTVKLLQKSDELLDYRYKKMFVNVHYCILVLEKRIVVEQDLLSQKMVMHLHAHM